MSSIAPVARRELVRIALDARAAAPVAARPRQDAPLTETVELERLIAANRMLQRSLEARAPAW